MRLPREHLERSIERDRRVYCVKVVSSRGSWLFSITGTLLTKSRFRGCLEPRLAWNLKRLFSSISVRLLSLQMYFARRLRERQIDREGQRLNVARRDVTCSDLYALFSRFKPRRRKRCARKAASRERPRGEAVLCNSDSMESDARAGDIDGRRCTIALASLSRA